MKTEDREWFFDEKEWTHSTSSEDRIRYRLFTCAFCYGVGRALILEENNKK